MSYFHNFRQVDQNTIYTNIAACQSSIFDATGARAAWVTTSTLSGAVSTVSSLTVAGNVFRDMGKTIYLPGPTTASAVGAQSTILRKVQYIPFSSLGYYGTGGTSNTTGTDFFTGYIDLGGQTYAGGEGRGEGVGYAAAPSVFIRSN